MEESTKNKNNITGIIIAILMIIGLPLLLAGVASIQRVRGDTRAIVTMLNSSDPENEPVLVADEKMRRELEPLIHNQIFVKDDGSIIESDKYWAIFWREQNTLSPEDYGLLDSVAYRVVADIADGRYVAFELEKNTP